MSTIRSGRGMESDADAGSRDPRNLLVEVIADAVDKLRPRALIVENVRAFLTKRVWDPRTGDPISAAALLAIRLKDRYVLQPAIVQMADYGVPQNRQRVFMTFFDRRDVAAGTILAHGISPYPSPTHSGQHVSVDQALRDMRLSKLDASRPELARDRERELHTVPVWEERRYAMVAAIPPNSGKTAWQNDTCLECGAVTDATEAVICFECNAILPRPVVHDEKGPRLISGFRRSSYSRMNPSLPAATITTASGRVGGSNTIHPSQNRVLSPLECAGLQTFPENFRWGNSRELHGDGFVREVIGEAVPPRFTEAHGKVVASLLNGRRPRVALSSSSPSVSRATKILQAESGLASLTE